jgi:heme exporter protein A
MAQHLSLGQQRRIAFARILLNPGKIWLLDEPMIGLDKKAQEWQLTLFENHLHAGGMIVIATHQPLSLANKIKTIQLGVV